MLRFLTHWFRNSRAGSKQTVTLLDESKPVPKLPEHVHLHWHFSDLAKIPSEVVWNANSALVAGYTQSERIPTIPAPYDETLLEKTRTQWQFGDWESLVKLEQDAIQQHPERAKLALLAAAGHQQLGDMTSARRYVNLAREWGCDKKLVTRVLIAGVHNTLAKMAALNKNEIRSLDHLNAYIQLTGSNNKFHNKNKTAYFYLQQNDQLKIDESDLIDRVMEECLSSDDIHEKIDSYLFDSCLSEPVKFKFCISLSECFYHNKDNLMAQNFLNRAQDYCSEDLAISNSQKKIISKQFIKYGRSADALDIAIQKLVSDDDFTETEVKALLNSYETLRAGSKAKNEHGHEVLLHHLKTNALKYTDIFKDRNPVLIEIGTTREDVPGQGSTRKLAEFCQSAKIDFITVDMDPHNISTAKKLFCKISPTFQAVNMKGEDFLKQYTGKMDYVFLDAYDFDHGKHTELRQSRYEKFLGERIDEQQCHKMHLDCAETIANKLSSEGVICIDDTWPDDKGLWCAKGTLAMPYLLNNGFEIIEARNKSVLLRRKQNDT